MQDVTHVVTHTISLTGAGSSSISIAPGHELPEHAAYLGVLHGLHEGLCECAQCQPRDDYDPESWRDDPRLVDDGTGGVTQADADRAP